MGRPRTQHSGLTDKARATVAGVQEKTGEAIDSARGRAGNLQARLADTLEVRGRDRPATWLREHDLTDLGGFVEQQLRERPGRTALIALVLGVVLGRAFRR
jgi:hypothetical protein